jgi:predicted XRE-type DNA-binding protein
MNLGLKAAAEKKTKVRLAVAINEIVAQARLSQAAAAERLGSISRRFRPWRTTGCRAFPSSG